MLFNELHIRDFTREELLQQVCLGNFELTPAVCETLVQYIVLLMNDYEELQEVYENYAHRDDYAELQDDLEDVKFQVDNLEGELEDANQKIESLETDVEDRDRIITELLGVIKAHNLTDEIATEDKKYIHDNVLNRKEL